jgi:hypothetical protein
LDLWKDIWGDPGAQKNGRSGQPQASVDVFGQTDGKWIGLQCKQKDGLLRTTVTRKELEVEVGNALKFKPRLAKFILATSGPRDVNLQERARQIATRHKSKRLFSVEVWSWEDIWHELYQRERLLNRVQKVYWPRTFQLAPRQREKARPMGKPSQSVPQNKGVVAISQLSSPYRLSGEEYAIELLKNPIDLARDDDGNVTVTVDRSDVQQAIISQKGKIASGRHFVHEPPRQDLIEKDKDIQEFLTGSGKVSPCRIDLKELGICLRWASGGVLSIVTFKGRKWVPLFFRDIPPYGWNIALGSTERWFDRSGDVRKASQLETEYNYPLNYALREFIEETLVVSGTQDESGRAFREPRLRPFKFSGLAEKVLAKTGNFDLAFMQGRDFDKRHCELRRSQDRLRLHPSTDHALKPAVGSGCCTVEVISDLPEPTRTSDVLVCFSLLDLGIEVVKVLEYSIDNTDLMLDGEIKKDKQQADQIVRMPIALVSCEYLATVFGNPNVTLEYDFHFYPPSICMPFHPRKWRDIHMFSYDIEGRVRVMLGEMGTNWQRDRFNKWKHLFGSNFLTKDGRLCYRKPSNLFVPGAAKILNLFFSKVWKKKLQSL